MVAFITSPIDTLLQGATRARAPSRTCTAVPTLPCKPNSRCDLRETKLAPNTRWGSRSRDPIGYEGSEWDLYEFLDSTPLVKLDFLGLGCFICTKLQDVTEMKDENGKVVGCALRYKFDSDVPTKVIAGKSCPKDCQPVGDCLDIPKLQELEILHFKEPKYRGYPFFKTAYCPPASDWDQSDCFGINSINCKGDFAKEFVSCKEACKDPAFIEHLCKIIRIPGLKRACEVLIGGSVELCIHYCEASKLQRVDLKQ